MSRPTRAWQTQRITPHLNEVGPQSAIESLRSRATFRIGPIPPETCTSVVPEFIPPESETDYLAGWDRGRKAADEGPLPDEVAREVVQILEAGEGIVRIKGAR